MVLSCPTLRLPAEAGHGGPGALYHVTCATLRHAHLPYTLSYHHSVADYLRIGWHQNLGKVTLGALETVKGNVVFENNPKLEFTSGAFSKLKRVDAQLNFNDNFAVCSKNQPFCLRTSAAPSKLSFDVLEKVGLIYFYRNGSVPQAMAAPLCLFFVGGFFFASAHFIDLGLKGHHLGRGSRHTPFLGPPPFLVFILSSADPPRNPGDKLGLFSVSFPNPMVVDNYGTRSFNLASLVAAG